MDAVWLLSLKSNKMTNAQTYYNGTKQDHHTFVLFTSYFLYLFVIFLKHR